MTSDTACRAKLLPGITPLRATVAAVLVAALVVSLVSRTIPFDSDEANHANIALRQYQDLADGRFTDFLRHSYRTGQFPFFHGWTVLPSFALLGTTLFAARVAQVLHFVVGAAATAFAAWRACGEDKRAGGLAGALFALSPALAVYSGLCMLETPGAAAVAVTFALLSEALRSGGRRAVLLDVLTAGGVLATWFTKLNYGIWLLPAVGVGYLVPIGRGIDRRRAITGLATYVGTLALVLGAWYATPSQRAAFFGFLTNPPQAVSVVADDPAFHLPAFSTSNFQAYFGLVSEEFHVHWTVGAAVLLLFVVGTVRAAIRREGVVAAAAACVLWTWLSLSMGFREYALGRFIAPALPALWIVAVYGVAPAFARVGERTWFRVVERVVLFAGLGAQVFAVRERLPAEYEVDDRYAEVFAWVTETLPPPASVMVMNYTDHVSARTLAWEFGSREGGSYRDVDVTGLIGERVYESDKLFGQWMDTPRPWGAANWGSFVVEIVPDGPEFDGRALQMPTVAMWHAAIERQAAAGRLVKTGERWFPRGGLSVRLWKDRTPPPHRGAGGD